MSAPRSLRSADVAVGAELPPLEVPITPTRVVATAIASRDFMPAHHDPGFARGQGAPDIFLNILTTNGYVSRFVTDWAGPECRVERIAIRLGVPAVPGQVLRFTGQVLEATPRDDECAVEVSVRAANDLGDHATGTVRLTVPLSEPA